MPQFSAGITGTGYTFDLPNFVGELFNVSPTDTPLLSAIGGLTGGQPADATLFTWSTYDLRPPSTDRQRVEGADAPDANNRARGSASNVVEIHQEAVSVSYTKQAATGQFNSPGGANANQNLSGSNAVTDELSWQARQALTSIALDVENTFIKGSFNNPATRDDTGVNVRQTRGLLEAIVTNATALSDGADGPGALTLDSLFQLMQDIWDEGGMREGETRTLITNSAQKRNLTVLLRNDGQEVPRSRTVGGVNMQVIETDFGTLNVMLDRWMPPDQLAVVSMEELAPRFLPIPGKGFLFQEPLARAGSAYREQIYGEVGLEYGLELHHGKLTNVDTNPISRTP